ncbi:hypothetical protein VMCG_06953 [Cytospora schulzeri]|uniref:Uncharacterized protein n=1 Tax=Cytospora schulzeri TaxID=448051 RepID=A0A423W3V2_9PEZI|nr:hypothetical protein VMCG_06953 [Valsa malicola]
MVTSTKVKSSFDSVSKDNQALAAEIIHDFVPNRQNTTLTLSRGNDHNEPDETQLKSLLKRLYVSIVDFGQYRGSAATSDTKILATWESFFNPIETLAQIKPHGHMMAARMILYLTSAFTESHQLPRTYPMSKSSSRPIALRCNFLTALDDALLSHLTQIWSQSNKREVFAWVFSEYAVHDCRGDRLCHDHESVLTHEALHEQRRSDRFKAACVTRPDDLTPENGVRRRWKWTRPKGDSTVYPVHPECRRGVYDDFQKEDRLLMWQDIGSDGPIRGSYYYTLVDEDSVRDHAQGRERHTLRRSRQFVLDARKIAETNLAKDSRRLAESAMTRSKLPVELRLQVLGYLEDIMEHQYLSKLDLAAVYEPFPAISKKCTECHKRGNKAAEKMAKATCPQKTITIWSLPLRMFLKFHQKNSGDWTLCTLSDCIGHHLEASWSFPSQGVGLEDHLNEVLQARCGPGTTIRSIGLGSLDPLALPTEEDDEKRSRRLFSNDRSDIEKQDQQEEDLWIGVNGLVDVMLHGRTLLGVNPSGGIRKTTEPSWMLGRTRQDEQKVRLALKHGPPQCGYC